MGKFVIVGAGKTGRGFLARLLQGHSLSLIDKNETLVDALNQDKQIPITFFGDKNPPVSIAIDRAYTWQTITADVFSNVDAVLVSVGGTNLADVGLELKKYINAETKVIVCENASAPAKKLGQAIGIENLRIAESTIFCTTIEKEPGSLAINSEWYPYLQFDGSVFENTDWAPKGLKPVFNFDGFLDRKLYTYNSASCIIAYLGAFKGYTVYGEAANDPEILALLDRNYESINYCICKEYGYEEQDQQEFALLSRNKFTDKTLVDTVARNAREPQRKLTHTERIVAPMLLQQKYGMESSVLEMTLAAALLYTPAEETQWNDLLAEQGYEGILQNLCGLPPSNPAFQRVLQMAQTRNII